MRLESIMLICTIGLFTAYIIFLQKDLYNNGAHMYICIQFKNNVIWINSTKTVYNKWERNKPTKVMET